nr:peptidylprolyl isomerase [uncultured Lichenicoccus sp.]
MVRLSILGTLAMAIIPALADAAPPPTPVEIVAAAPSSAWSTIPPDELMLLDIAVGPAGTTRRVTIQLAPGFAPAHVANIRRLIAARSFEQTSVVRVQDDYVVQWGDASRPPPPGLVAHPPAEYQRALQGLAITPLAGPDAYAPAVGFALGWPVGYDRASNTAWLAHCYGIVGVGRDMPPDTGSGAELYAVIGQAPRQLDRNIALVGRIIDGIDVLDTLPRGTAALGFYAQAAQRTPIRRVRLASELAAAGRPSWQVMLTGSPAFAAYVAARANRRDPFYVRPAGGVDLCNVPVPVRRHP